MDKDGRERWSFFQGYETLKMDKGELKLESFYCHTDFKNNSFGTIFQILGEVGPLRLPRERDPGSVLSTMCRVQLQKVHAALHASI